MAKTSVIIAATQDETVPGLAPRFDLQAHGFKAAVSEIDDMELVGGRIHSIAEIPTALALVPASQGCALALIGRPEELRAQEARWLAERPRLVILRVEVIGEFVRIALRDPNMKLVLDYLRELVVRAERDPLDRVSNLRLQASATSATALAATETAAPRERPLLDAAIGWIRAVLCNAGLTLMCGETVVATDAADEESERKRRQAAVTQTDLALSAALRANEHDTDPLALLARRLNLSPVEFRLVLLALSPEIDVIYQRGLASLQEDASRRVGTLGLYTALLGESNPVDIRRHLALSGRLARWRLFETRANSAVPAADEPLRLDAPLIEWLLGDAAALERDPRVERVLRPNAWPGASLIPDDDAVHAAANLQLLQQPADAPVVGTNRGAQWLLFNGDQTPTWYALLERAGDLLRSTPLRVLATRVTTLDALENAETSRRLARLARLSHRALLLDVARVEPGADQDDALRTLIAGLAAARCRAGIVCTNVSRFIGLLGIDSMRVVPETCTPQVARRRSLKAATLRLGVTLDDQLLETLEQQFPLQSDGWERALHLTRARRAAGETPAQLTPRFVAACRDVAAESVSNLATRLDPHCDIDDVVLPDERKAQLRQIVDGVRFARRVLEEWKFGEQLAYGRGVTALFHGPSGTGKTMSALGVAKALSSQVLRIDLSRVVSKYIGETEKHLDAVFRDATQCGAVLLIDEADALLGKRGEIKDAHDRYSAMEVSFLLQRIEAYDGVAIFTTNARQNIDPAFMRRLRFIIEFPRPDVAAREDIWRRCLPVDSHSLSDADLRQLARKIDMTGGHIRQITLQAAFLAAAANRKIELEHVAQASRAELAKIGLPPVALEPAAGQKAA